MLKPLSTAGFALFLGCTLGSAASAATSPTNANLSVSALPERPTISVMPSATADLTMWSVLPRGNAANGVQAPLWKFVRRPGHSSRRAATIRLFARSVVRRTSRLALHLTRDALRFIGAPYVFGGTSAAGFDCSGYVQHVFAMLGIALPRTADAQFDVGRPTSGGKVPGDLVFFQTYDEGPSHVGIYLGRGRFIHSSSSRGVTISSLSDPYWSDRYLGARRVADVSARHRRKHVRRFQAPIDWH